MCGPIAIALPLKQESWFARISSSLTYNIGRTITYGVLGAIFGLLGKGIAVGGLQQWASIGIGVIMVLSVIFPVLFRNINIESATYKMVGKTKKLFGKMFHIRSYGSLFIIGILNGFLPCGLVYIAIAGAIVLGSLEQGVMYMIAFGLGTIPIMLSLSVLGNVVSMKVRKKVGKIIPFFINLIGILFILRGLNLGIPYVSPKLDKSDSTKMECCH